MWQAIAGVCVKWLTRAARKIAGSETRSPAADAQGRDGAFRNRPVGHPLAPETVCFGNPAMAKRVLAIGIEPGNADYSAFP